MTNKKTSRATLGDVYEFETSDRYYYAQFINYHETLGYLLRLINGAFPKQARIETLQTLPTSYRFFYALPAAIKLQLIKIVGNLEVPPQETALPNMRTPLLLERGKARWEISGPTIKRHVVESLSENDRRLTVAEIVGHPIVVERLMLGWKPEKDSRWA